VRLKGVASYPLPFCLPQTFRSVWARIEGALVHGGRFCGQFFGDRDGWATSGDSPTHDKGEMSFHTRAHVEELLEGFAV